MKSMQLPVEITEEAIREIKRLMMQHDKEDHGLRISIKKGGCGKEYHFSLDIDANGSETIEYSGIRLFIDHESMEDIKGSKISFIDSLKGRGFRVDNPNVTSTCECGKAF